MKVSDRLVDLQQVLLHVWSRQSSSQWTAENPALGQCGVTALVVNDLFGGDILKTNTSGGVHFYNRISGERYDLTQSQFSEPVYYDDVLSSREEAFRNTNNEQYSYLTNMVLKNLP